MTDNDLLLLFTDTARQHLVYVEQRVQEFGLHAGQAAVIAALGEYGPCTQKKLAQLRGVSAPTISVMISRMEREGLIERLPEDGRFSRIYLTDKGRRLNDCLAADRLGEPDRVFADLSAEDRETAERILQTISKNLQEITGSV